MMRPLSPTIIESLKADPKNIRLLEEVVRASESPSFRTKMNDSELFMFLAQQLVFDVENNGLQSRESLQRIEQCIKGLINSCFQNQRVKETLIREERFMVVIGRILDANPDLATDVCDLIRNLAFHIDPLYHMALSQFVPKLCDNLLRVVNTYHNTQMWNEVGFKNTLDALWNLVAQSKQNKIAICQNPFALKVIIMGMNTTSHEEASGLLRCMRGTLFSHYLTLKPCFDESLFVDYLVNLLYCNSTKSVENVLLLLKDLIPLESPGILNYFRSDLMHIRQMRQQLRHTLCASWNPRISSTARYILEEQVGEQNADLMTEEQEEASTVLYGDCLDPYDDDLLEEFHPPLPDPLTPAINYQFNQGTYELIDLPQLEMGTPKRSR